MADITKNDAFIQNSPHPAWLASTQGQCVYANPALQRLTGLSSDQFNQTDWRGFVLEEDRTVVNASWQRSVATGSPYRAQVHMRDRDGSPKLAAELPEIMADRVQPAAGVHEPHA